MIASACVRIYTKPESKFMDTMFDIPCHRHADAYEILHMFRLRRYMEYDVIAEGFLDDKDNFLSRVDAWSEAFHCAQFPEKVMEQYWTGEKDPMVPTALYSEDLW